VPAHLKTVSGEAISVELNDHGVAHLRQLGDICTAIVISDHAEQFPVTQRGVLVRDPHFVVLFNGGREVLRVELQGPPRAGRVLTPRTPSLPARPRKTLNLRVNELSAATDPAAPPSWESLTLLAVVLFRRKKLVSVDPGLATHEVQAAAELWHSTKLTAPKISGLLKTAEANLGIAVEGTKRRQDVARNVAARALSSNWARQVEVDQADATLLKLEKEATD
jgi:hypothetical protein